MKPTLYFLLFLLLAGESLAQVAEDIDAELVDSVRDKDIKQTRVLLAKGANPNATIKLTRYDSVMCLASHPGMIDFLAELILHGADVNQAIKNGGTFHATPLACAVTEGAVLAFEALVKADAYLTPDLCPSCDDFGRTSLIENGIMSRSYSLVWRLIELGVSTSRDVETIVLVLENHPPGERSLLDPYRKRIIDWVREQGVDIQPKSGSASLRKRLGLD